MPLYKDRVLNAKTRKLPQIQGQVPKKKPVKPSSGKKSQPRSTSTSPGKRGRSPGPGKKVGSKPKASGKRGSSGSGKRGRSASKDSERRCFGRRKKSRSTSKSKGKRGSTGSGKKGKTKGSGKRDSTDSRKRGRSVTRRCFGRKKTGRSGSKGSGKRGSAGSGKKGRSGSKDSGKRGSKGRSGSKDSGKRGAKGRSGSKDSGKRCFGRRKKTRSTSGRGSSQKRGRSCFGRKKKSRSTSGKRGSAGRGNKGRSSSKGSGKKGRGRSSSKESKKGKKTKNAQNTWFSFREVKKSPGKRGSAGRGGKGRSSSKDAGKGGRKGSKGSGKRGSKGSGKGRRKGSKGSKKRGQKGSGKRGSKGSKKKGQKGSGKRGAKKVRKRSKESEEKVPKMPREFGAGSDRSDSRCRLKNIRKHLKHYGKEDWIGLARAIGTGLKNIPVCLGTTVRECLPDKNDVRDYFRENLPCRIKDNSIPKPFRRTNADRLHEVMHWIYTPMKFTFLMTFFIERKRNTYLITARRFTLWHICCVLAAAYYCYIFYLYFTNTYFLLFKKFEYLDGKRLIPEGCGRVRDKDNYKYPWALKMEAEMPPMKQGRYLRDTPIRANFSNWMDNDYCVFAYSVVLEQNLVYKNTAEVFIFGLTLFQATLVSVHMVVFAKKYARLIRSCYVCVNAVNIIPKRRLLNEWMLQEMYYMIFIVLFCVMVTFMEEWCLPIKMLHNGAEIVTMLFTRNFFFYFDVPYFQPSGKPYFMARGWPVVGMTLYTFAVITSRVWLLFFLAMCRLNRDLINVWNIRVEFAMNKDKHKEKFRGRRGLRTEFRRIWYDHFPLYVFGTEIGPMFGVPLYLYYLNQLFSADQGK